MNTFLVVLVLTLPFLAGLLATLGVHRWLRSDGYGTPPRRSPTRDWSVGDLPSRPYATLR